MWVERKAGKARLRSEFITKATVSFKKSIKPGNEVTGLAYIYIYTYIYTHIHTYVQLIYSIVLVSGVPQRDSVIYTHINLYSFF